MLPSFCFYLYCLFYEHNGECSWLSQIYSVTDKQTEMIFIFSVRTVLDCFPKIIPSWPCLSPLLLYITSIYYTITYRYFIYLSNLLSDYLNVCSIKLEGFVCFVFCFIPGA
jgi:hypothetical protein